MLVTLGWVICNLHPAYVQQEPCVCGMPLAPFQPAICPFPPACCVLLAGADKQT